MQKNVGISKIKKAWYSKVHFLKLHMCVYLHAKFQFSSIIVTGFRQVEGGVILTPPPTSKWTPKKPTQIGVNKVDSGTGVLL